MSTAPEDRCYRYTLSPDHGGLRGVREFVAEVAARAGLDEDRIFDLKVAVSEACANAVQHADEERALDVCARLEPERLVFEITDAGDFRLPRRGSDGVRTNRGIGLPLMVALTDEVRFHKLPTGGTMVSLALLLRRV